VSAVTFCGTARGNAAVCATLERCRSLLHERLGRRLVGLILTGSFSRGEGSVLPVNGHLRVLGDIEFLVILPHGRDYRALRPVLADWGREAGAAAAATGLVVDVEFGPEDRAYLARRARPSIFVHDLRTHGQVLHGSPALLELIAPFGPEQIPRVDAVHLLFNRAIEQLEAWDRVELISGEALFDLAYQRLKLTLDLAGSALAFEGRHVSSYAERPRAFAALLQRTPALAARLPAEFDDELERAARIKLAPQPEDVLPAGSLLAQRAWIRARIAAGVPALAALLRWELGALLGDDAPLPVLLERWVAAPSWPRRLRQWARLAIHPLPAPQPLSARRVAGLAWRSTPRALAYAAGAHAYLALAERAPARGRAAQLLPVAGPPPATDADERATVTNFWRWCIRND
jgi:hypothetical protein